MKEKIIKACIEGCLVERTLKYIKQSIKRSFLYVISIPGRIIRKVDYHIGVYARNVLSDQVEIQNNKIVFMTYNNAFMCNPKYIAEEIHRQNLPYDLVWIINKGAKNTHTNFPSYLRLVRRGSFDAFKELLTAKIWIDNSLNCIWQPIKKKPEQVYFETWHGSLGLKKAGANDVKDKYWVKRANCARDYTDYCISNSTFENFVFKDTHWPQTPILQLGHARNDILFNTDATRYELIKQKVYDYFGLDTDDQIALYAPTFRDSKTFDCYNVDYSRLVRALETRFGGKWKILLRHHFHNRKAGAKVSGNDFLINATSYIDMQELLVVTEVGISDYSSWVCDFVLTKRPCFLYTVDLEEYNNERGLYYPLETTPFPVATNNDELINNILAFDQEKYSLAAEKFIKEKGCIDDGHASERIVEKIRSIIDSSTDQPQT